jgi:hypothetical protein
VVIIFTCIWEVTGSNFERYIDYLDLTNFLVFPQAFLLNASISYLHRPQLLLNPFKLPKCDHFITLFVAKLTLECMECHCITNCHPYLLSMLIFGLA